MLIGLQSTSLLGQSHVSEPAVNLGDTSFLDAPAGPGFVAETIGDGAHDGTITDSSGNAVPGASAVNSISNLTHVAWLSPKQLLGSWYGVEVVLWKGLWIGPNAYYLKQISDGKIDAVALRNSPEQGGSDRARNGLEQQKLVLLCQHVSGVWGGKSRCGS
jgi:hypothetical protein